MAAMAIGPRLRTVDHSPCLAVSIVGLPSPTFGEPPPPLLDAGHPPHHRPPSETTKNISGHHFWSPSCLHDHHLPHATASPHRRQEPPLLPISSRCLFPLASTQLRPPSPPRSKPPPKVEPAAFFLHGNRLQTSPSSPAAASLPAAYRRSCLTAQCHRLRCCYRPSSSSPPSLVSARSHRCCGHHPISTMGTAPAKICRFLLFSTSLSPSSAHGRHLCPSQSPSSSITIAPKLSTPAIFAIAAMVASPPSLPSSILARCHELPMITVVPSWLPNCCCLTLSVPKQSHGFTPSRPPLVELLSAIEVAAPLLFCTAPATIQIKRNAVLKLLTKEPTTENS